MRPARTRSFEGRGPRRGRHPCRWRRGTTARRSLVRTATFDSRRPFHSRRDGPIGLSPQKGRHARAENGRRKATDEDSRDGASRSLIFAQFVDIPTNDNGVFASAIVPSRGERLRQNVCQKSDSIPFAEYLMRSRAVDTRVQGGAERLARPRSKDVEATLCSTSTSRSVPVRGRSIEVRRVGRKE